MKKLYSCLLILPFIVSCNKVSSNASTDESSSSSTIEETNPGAELLDNIDIKKDEKVTFIIACHSVKSYFYTLCDKTTSYDLEEDEEINTTKYDNQVLCSNQIIRRKETNKSGKYESTHEYETTLWVNSNHELYSSMITIVNGETQKSECSRVLTSEQLITAEENGSGFDDITALGLNRDAKLYYDSLKNEATFSMDFNPDTGELNFSIYQELLFIDDTAISTEYGDNITVYVYSNYHAVYDEENASFISSEYIVKKEIKINPVTGKNLDEPFTYYYEENKSSDISFSSQGQYSEELQDGNS